MTSKYCHSKINLFSETPLLFENAFYEGSIVDNTLQLSSLVLSEGYEGFTVSAEVVGGKYSTLRIAIIDALILQTNDQDYPTLHLVLKLLDVYNRKIARHTLNN